uniref:cyclin-A1-1-like n=1 Tax=Erigeron canadensis TaxID=72917 RepID=UPI001CB8EEEE|nr:cyclin-A1-1-like [Erigeron canadensis]
MACDIYHNFRESEEDKRPAVDFMEMVQEDITRCMRAILMDWLVEVAIEYKLLPETLFLAVNYIDRYLSVIPIDRERLQLLGVTCMMIDAKYEEISAPHVEDFCYITDNTYSQNEVLQMEFSVLHYLKFEMTAPTVRCFLMLLLPFAQLDNLAHHQPKLQFLASYICELTLIEYNMLRYPPSLIASSAIFLARFLLTQEPWNLTLMYYTRYQPSDLQECVEALRVLVFESSASSLKAISEKYSQDKYKCVAEITCPASIPLENFDNIRSGQIDPTSS